MRFMEICVFMILELRNTNKPLGILVFSPSGEKVDFCKYFIIFKKYCYISHLFIFSRNLLDFQENHEKSIGNTLWIHCSFHWFWPEGAEIVKLGANLWNLLKFTKLLEISWNYQSFSEKLFLRPGLKTSAIP